MVSTCNANFKISTQQVALLIQMLLQYLFFIQSYHIATCEYEAYVTNDGTFNTECTRENTCGSLSFVLYNIGTWNEYGRKIINDEHITIYVNGHFNTSKYSMPPANYSYYSRIASVDVDYLRQCYPFIETSITVIFNESIHSTNDWYPLLSWCQQNKPYAFGYGSISIPSSHSLWTITSIPYPEILYTGSPGTHLTVKFEHLIYDNTSFWLIDMKNPSFSPLLSSFHCKRCIFRDLSTGVEVYTDVSKPAFMRLGTDAVFENCTFKNIAVMAQCTCTIKPSDWVSFIRAFGNAIFLKCQFGNIYIVGNPVHVQTAHFISTTRDTDMFNHINFERITVNNLNQAPYQTTRFMYANTEGITFNSHTIINITDSSFYGPLNIIYIDSGAYFVDITNIYIESTQHVPHNIITGTKYNINIDFHYFYNVIHIEQGCRLNLNNIHYQSILKCGSHTWSCAYSGGQFLLPFCETPVGLLYNDGKTIANNIMLSSNYNSMDSAYRQYEEGMFYARNEYYSTVDLTCDSSVDLLYLPYFASIYNDAFGELSMENITFRNGAHNTFLRNYGVAHIDSISTETNTEQYLSNPWNLNPLN
eukprot:322579_1